MPLVDGDVDGLAERAARMMDGGRHVGELYEIAEVLDVGVAAALVEVADEWRAVDGREDRRLAADLDRPGGIARMLGEGPGRGLDEPAQEPLGKLDTRAVNVGPGVAPHAQRFLVVFEFDADLGEDAIGVGLDGREPFLAQDRVGLEPAADVGELRPCSCLPALGPPRIRSASAPLTLAVSCVVHRGSSAAQGWL